MNKAMQVTIAKAVLAGWRIEPRGRFWHLYSPEGGWIGMLFDSPYDAAKQAVVYQEQRP